MLGGAATNIDASATVTDIDSSDFDTGQLVVRFTANGTSNDRLVIENQGTSAGQISVSGATVSFGGTAIGTFSGGTGLTDLVVQFNASCTPAAAQALLRAIQFDNVSGTPSTAPR